MKAFSVLIEGSPWVMFGELSGKVRWQAIEIFYSGEKIPPFPQVVVRRLPGYDGYWRDGIETGVAYRASRILELCND